MSIMLDGPPNRHYEIPILSRCVLRIYVRSGLDLLLSDEAGNPAIQIADPIAIVTENDPLVRLSDPALPTFGKVIVCGSDLRRGRRLQIVFVPGIWFRAEPQAPASGTWGPVGSKGLILISMPGSEIALWFGRHRLPEAVASFSPAVS